MSAGRRFKAFTLVELLVVIGIIALLISILLPALSKAREQALIVACSAQLRDYSNAILMYAQENKQSFPGPCPGQIRSGYWDNSQLLVWYLWRYLKLPDPKNAPTSATAIFSPITLCPGYNAKKSGAAASNALMWTYTMTLYDPWLWTGYSGMGTNSYLSGPIQDARQGHISSGPFTGNLMPLKLSQVFDGPEMPLIMDIDQGEVTFESGGAASVSEYPNHGGRIEKKAGILEVTGGPFYQIIDASAATNPPRNTLFCDGHVATFRRSGPVIPGDLARYGTPPPGGPYLAN